MLQLMLSYKCQTIGKQIAVIIVFLLSYRNTSESWGEQEMLWEHEPQPSVSTAFLSSPRFCNSIELRTTCFPFLLENTMTQKEKTNWSTSIIKM